MANKYVRRSSDAAASWTGAHAGIGVDSDDNILYINPTGTRVAIIDATSTQTLTGKTVSGPAPVETAAAADTITAAESGKTFFLDHATEFALTLPAPAAGLHYSFIVANAPETASYTIVSAGGTDNIHGVVASAADAGGSVDSTSGTAADTITFVDGQAAIGDRVDVISNGTLWFAFGLCADEDAITFTAT